MNVTIAPMEEAHRETILSMMRTFYASPAVLSNGSEEIFAADIDECVSENPFLEGFVFCRGQELLGYGMAAKSFSTEFGKPCIWIEDLYVRPEYRGQGIGSAFLEFMTRRYPSAILRLEVEEENERAIAVYRKSGVHVIPYMEMKKE
jgi:ribosomal protein S18 acetylase RimI-like enzyme